MKRTLNTLAAIAIVGSAVVSSAYAEEMRPRTEGLPNAGMTSAPAPRDESAYWAQKKLEAQQKSTEMRKQRVQEMQAKGVDTSSITPDLLDGTKTEEKLFWDAMKLIMQKQDAANRQKIADELKKAGYDTSALRADILDPSKSDEPKFWNAVKAIRESKDGAMIRQNDPGMRPPMGNDSNRPNGDMKPNERGERPDDSNMRPNENGPVRTPNNKPSGDMKGGERQNNTNGMNASGKDDMQKPAQKPVLTEKMRQALVKRFNAVADEKKAAYYAKTKTNLEAQLEKAKANKNNRLARKIVETLAILDYVLGSVDDAADDDVINSATAE